MLNSHEQEIVQLLIDVRKGDGITSQILNHRQNLFRLLGVDKPEQAVEAVKDAAATLEETRNIRAALNALNLDRSGLDLTGRRKQLISEMQQEDKRSGPTQTERSSPGTTVGLASWEDRGFRAIAVALAEHVPSGNVTHDIGRLNRQVLRLESELQRVQDLSNYRDEKLKSAILEMAVSMRMLLNAPTPEEVSETVKRLQGLVTLCAGPGEIPRPLDLYGPFVSDSVQRDHGLFKESLTTSHIMVPLGEPPEKMSRSDPKRTDDQSPEQSSASVSNSNSDLETQAKSIPEREPEQGVRRQGISRLIRRWASSPEIPRK